MFIYYKNCTHFLNKMLFEMYPIFLRFFFQKILAIMAVAPTINVYIFNARITLISQNITP
jgi:hypothetical protein